MASCLLQRSLHGSSRSIRAGRVSRNNASSSASLLLVPPQQQHPRMMILSSHGPKRWMSSRGSPDTMFYNTNLLTSADDERGRGIHPGKQEPSGHRTLIWKRMLPNPSDLDVPPSGHELDEVYTQRLRKGKPEYSLEPLPEEEGSEINLTVSIGLGEGLVAISDIPPQWRDANRKADAHYRYEDARGNQRVEWLYIRPGVENFLKRLSGNPRIDLCLWTSLPSWRATPILDYLDPEGEHFRDARFWFSTTPVQSRETDRILFVKDARILGRPMDRTVMVDGRTTAGLLNPNNVLPLLPLNTPSTDAPWSEEVLTKDLEQTAELLEQLTEDPSLDVTAWLPDQVQTIKSQLFPQFQERREEEGALRMLCNHRNELIVGGATGPSFYFESERDAIDG